MRVLPKQEKIAAAEYIRGLREKLNATQAEMANRLGVGISTYSGWEQGRNLRPLILLLRIRNLEN